MKKLFIILTMALLPLVSFSQQKPQLEFTDKTVSPSQAIYIELFNSYKEFPSSPLDSVCVFNISTIKFTVTPEGKISNIVTSVGLPPILTELLKRSIKKTEGRWVNHKKSGIDCILPLIIMPASSCPEERPFEILQSGAQMLKYQGKYVKFTTPNFYDYNTDSVESLVISPIFLWSGGIP